MNGAPTHGYLLDANVLIAGTIEEHEHHLRASTWIGCIDQFAVCPIVEGALVRTLLRLGESAAVAAQVVRQVRSSEKCVFIADDLSFADVDLTNLVGHRQVTDAYLVQLAVHHGCRLATLDQGLAQTHGERCLLLPE